MGGEDVGLLLGRVGCAEEIWAGLDLSWGWEG